MNDITRMNLYKIFIIYPFISTRNFLLFLLFACWDIGRGGFSAFTTLYHFFCQKTNHIDDIYESERTRRKYDCYFDGGADGADFNENAAIDRKRLSTEEFFQMENLWKQRVLMEYVYSQQENIIMYYDYYKEGFAYYCNSQYTPYSILNNIARRYVITYRCKEFFTDDTAAGAEGAEEAAKAAATEKNTIPICKKIKTIQIGGDGGGGGAKFLRGSGVKRVVTLYEKKMNKFIRVGNIPDFSFCKKPHCKTSSTGKNISYKSYKLLSGGGGGGGAAL